MLSISHLSYPVCMTPKPVLFVLYSTQHIFTGKFFLCRIKLCASYHLWRWLFSHNPQQVGPVTEPCNVQNKISHMFLSFALGNIIESRLRDILTKVLKGILPVVKSSNDHRQIWIQWWAVGKNLSFKIEPLKVLTLPFVSCVLLYKRRWKTSVSSHKCKRWSEWEFSSLQPAFFTTEPKAAVPETFP